MEKLTDNEIKKALDAIVKLSSGIVIDWGINRTDSEAIYKTAKGALDLINRLEKANNDLILELEGVMWSVDKWLDGDELKQDKVNRAITMREKTLQITEKQEAEIERLKENVKKLGKEQYDLCSQIVDLKDDVKYAKTEAIKEFMETVLTLFPADKDFTTISRFTIRQVAKTLTESVNYESSKTEGVVK